MLLSQNAQKRLARAHVRAEIARLGGPEKVTKEDLGKLAEKIGVSVVRTDGKDGEPVRGDYLKALGL